MPTSLKQFETVFPTLVADLKENCKKYSLPDQALTWFEKVLHLAPNVHTGID